MISVLHNAWAADYALAGSGVKWTSQKEEQEKNEDIVS